MQDDPTQPKERKGCLIKIILGVAVWILVALIHALTAESRPYGGTAPMNPILSMLGCGAIVALWLWKPKSNNFSNETGIKPLDKGDAESSDDN